MRFGVVVFPGTWSDTDTHHVLSEVFHRQVEYVWHKETDLSRFDCVILPGGFSYGDYLRCGAIARFSPVMSAVTDFAEGRRTRRRHLQRLPDPLRGRSAARRADAKRRPPVPLHVGEPPVRDR